MNAQARSEFYDRISRFDVAPLWEVLHQLVPRAPRSPCVPALFPWATMRPLLMEAGRLVTAEEAERRVLVLENPGLRGKSRLTQSLYAGLQLILPGEIAAPHRHSQSALRFVIEGSGAYTAVDGMRVNMSPGDYIITPAWTFHEHGNPGDEAVVWLDGLDLPVVEILDAQFFEPGSSGTERAQPLQPLSSASTFRAGMLPHDFGRKGMASPLFWYPYELSRRALEDLARTEEAHPAHGHKLEYVNPATGGPTLPTMGAYLQYLTAGFQGRAYRCTEGKIFKVVEGTGVVRIADQSFVFGQHDVFTVPSWHSHSISACTNCVLFSFSDKPIQTALGVWREQA